MDLLATIMEEPIAEEEIIQTKEIKFEERPKEKKNISSFLLPITKYRIAKGILNLPEDPEANINSSNNNLLTENLKQDNKTLL